MLLNSTPQGLIVLLALAGCAAPDTQPAALPAALPAQAASQPPSDQAAQRPTSLRELSNLPPIDTLEEALAYAEEAKNLLSYQGLVLGSERFPVTLPSGERVTNWTINAFYRDLFQPYGEKAYRQLAERLTHPQLFVQVGAYSVLNSYMYARGLKWHLDDTEAQRIATRDKLISILERGN